MNNFESVFDNTNSHELLAVVSAVHHERAGQTLDNWAESLVKSLDLITASRVWYIFGRLTFDWYVILGESLKIETKLDNFLFFSYPPKKKLRSYSQRDILDIDLIAVPFAEQFHLVGVDFGRRCCHNYFLRHFY